MSGEEPSGACPVCGQTAPLAAHGLIAPFVAELIAAPLDLHVGFRDCAGCGLAFFDYRYSDPEIERLYHGYRGEAYETVRRSWEPWYRSAVNDAYAPGTAALADRVAFATGILRRGGLDRPVRLAVDYGGDRGQFFPPSVEIERRVVLEISDQPLLPGVERVDALESLDIRPDLVLLSHVLEHVSRPLQLLREIRGQIDPNGLLYVEVPLERPRVRRWHSGALFARWTDLIAGRRFAFVPFDFLSGVARQLGRRIPRLGVVKESEHINFFDPRSLRLALEASGFGVTAQQADPDSKVGGMRFGRLGMAAGPVAFEGTTP